MCTNSRLHGSPRAGDEQRHLGSKRLGGTSRANHRSGQRARALASGLVVSTTGGGLAASSRCRSSTPGSWRSGTDFHRECEAVREHRAPTMHATYRDRAGDKGRMSAGVGPPSRAVVRARTTAETSSPPRDNGARAHNGLGTRAPGFVQVVSRILGLKSVCPTAYGGRKASRPVSFVSPTNCGGRAASFRCRSSIAGSWRSGRDLSP